MRCRVNLDILTQYQFSLNLFLSERRWSGLVHMHIQSLKDIRLMETIQGWLELIPNLLGLYSVVNYLILTQIVQGLMHINI